MRRWAVRALVLLLACSLAGCALLYSYRNIDRYIRWSLDDYVAWNPAQEHALRARLGAQLEWHRATQLPRYREWLEATDRLLDDDVDAAQLTAAADRLESFWQDVAAHAQADIAAQLAALSDAQVDDLIDVMHEKQAELQGEYDDMTPATLVKQRKRDMTRVLRYWLGPLEAGQLAAIEAWAHALPDGRAPWLDNRARWTNTFAQALRQRHEPEPFAAAIGRLFVTPRASWTAEVRELALRNRAATLQLLADVHNARTPRQRDAERRRVAQWLDRIDQLAAR